MSLTNGRLGIDSGALLTADYLAAHIFRLSPADRLRLREICFPELSDRLSSYQNGRFIRHDRIEQRNALLHQIITERHFPTATLADWRRLAQELQLAAWWLSTRRDPGIDLWQEPANPSPQAFPYLSARTLRTGYRHRLPNHAAEPSR